MLIPGSQARLLVGSVGASLTTWFVYRFRQANVRIRAPRIDVTNSEGLPGAVRSNTFDFFMPGLNPGRMSAPAGMTNILPQFKEFPYESQLPGIAVADVEVEAASWDNEQIPFVLPTAVARTFLIPQRYIACVIRPVWWQTRADFNYLFPSLYIEESNQRINVKQDQPITFTGYSNGPFNVPWSNDGSGALNTPIHGNFPTGGIGSTLGLPSV